LELLAVAARNRSVEPTVAKLVATRVPTGDGTAFGLDGEMLALAIVFDSVRFFRIRSADFPLRSGGDFDERHAPR
jgi:hypothetical protein